MFGLTRDFDVSLLVSVTETLQSRFLPVNIPFVSGSHGEAFLRGCDDERGGKKSKKRKKTHRIFFPEHLSDSQPTAFSEGRQSASTCP